MLEKNMTAHENISQTKTSNYTNKLQTLNEENSPIMTGNIPSDNENLFVNSTRRVADVTGFYSNLKTTGADGTRKSHVAEVDCIMQADPNESGTQQKADIGFPTPPPTPKKILPNGKTAFPLFESLLNEGVNEQLNKQQQQRAPATAPILVNTTTYCQPIHRQPTEIRVHSPEKSTVYKSNPGLVVNLRFDGAMDQKDVDEKKEQIAKAVEEAMKVGKAKQDEENIQPITLQDPPKPKLKRQLSVGTFEKTERDRSPKRAYTPKKALPKGVGSEQVWTPYVDPKPDEVDGTPTAAKPDTPTALDRGTLETYHQFASSQKAQGFGEPLSSPHYFNLKDIELTSPFLTSTSRRSSERDENVFVFPEAAGQRTSPVKQSPSRSISTAAFQPQLPVTSTRHPDSSELLQSSPVKTPVLSQQRVHVTGAVKDTSVPSHFAHQRLPEYVSHEGFKWPKVATITEPIPFSPRVVTATAKPNLSQPTDAPDYRTNEEIEKLQERIKLLEKEYERAKEIYRPKPANNCQFSPGSREIQNILRRSALRSISDIERSPNEKEIRRIEEEVKSRYERSISDPTYNPRHRQRFVPHPSPLGKQNISHTGDENNYKDAQDPFHAQGAERWHESWQADVRRQLFTSEDLNPVYDPLPTPTSESVFLEDIQLPDEVARFFHSKSFHPEDLENLKGILKRSHDQHVQEARTSHERLHQVERRPVSTLPAETVQSRIMSGDYRNIEAQRNLLASFDNVRQFIGSPLLSKTQGADKRPTSLLVNRERKIGDIDVRISCESISEKVRQAKEILKDLEHNTGSCQCQVIEQEILGMTNEAFARIRRMDRTNESFIKFSEELNEANTNVYRSLEILCGIKCMCKYGRTLDEIYSGSIVFMFNCPNLYALEDLWESYKSGELERLVMKTFVTQELKDKYNADDIKLKVTVSWEEYKRCKSELEIAENGLLSCLSPTQSSFQTSSPLPVSHCRSRSEPIVNSVSACSQLYKPTMSPFRERICSDSTVELSPRRAFQEINVGKDTSRLSISPSKKSLLENVFAESDPRRSPKLSPRRKSFVFKSPWEHENIEPESRTSDSVQHRVSDV